MIRFEKLRIPLLIAGVVFLGLAAPGMFRGSEIAYQSYLVAFMYWFGISIGALGLIVIQHLTGGRWGIVIRRQLEAAASVMPACAILFLPIALGGMEALYPWARPDVIAVDHHIQKISAYLNPSGFLIRATIYFAIWIGYVTVLLKRSSRQDTAPVPSYDRIAAPGIIVVILTGTFAITDWMMSLEPRWFSTIYGIKVLVGNACAALALSIIMVSNLKGENKLRDVATVDRFHDLGNLLFAITMFWTYLNFSQFILTWSANLAEEAPWYLRRRAHGWNPVSVVLVIVHFALPFYILIVRAVKRSPKYLSLAAGLLLFAEWLYKFWLIAPPGRPEFGVTLTDVTAFIGVGGIWFFFFITRLKSRPLIPLGDAETAGAGS